MIREISQTSRNSFAFAASPALRRRIERPAIRALRGAFTALMMVLGGCLLLSSALPSVAYAQSTTCAEDGGQAYCTAPLFGPPQYQVYDPFFGNTNSPTELGIYLHLQDAVGGLYCPGTVNTQVPPWAWSLEHNFPSAIYWDTQVALSGQTGQCGAGPPNEVPFTDYYYPVEWISNLGCPVGWTTGGETTNYPYGSCIRPYCQRCQQKQCPQVVGAPIDPADGNETESAVDYAGIGHLQFVRTYNYAGTILGPGTSNGAAGMGWNHSYEYRLWFFAGGAVRILRPDGNDRLFLPVSGGYQEYGTGVDQLKPITGNPSGAVWEVIDENDNQLYFDPNGNLLSLTFRGGDTLTFTYSSVTTPTNVAPEIGLLLTASDAYGHQLQFTYNAQLQIATLTDPSGGVTTYTYTAVSGLPQGLLTSVAYPDSTTRQYIYNESAYTQGANIPYALTGVVDELGNRYETISYNSQGQAIGSVLAGGVDQFTVTPGSLTAGAGPATITDPLGMSRTYGYSLVNGVEKFTGSNVVCPNCTDAPASVAYDANGNFASRTDFDNNLTTSVYNLTRNLETSRVEASGTSIARTITTTWDPNWRQPDLVTEPNRTTGYTYNSLGGVLTKTITDTTVTPNTTRVWTYTYDGYGRILTAKGPRTDVNSTTTYAYYTCTTGSQCGQLQTVTDALGHVTTYNTYNTFGQPLTITDPNGTVTTLTYDKRQRLLSRGGGWIRAESSAFLWIT